MVKETLNKEKIETLIISDLHLGGDDSRCDEILKLFKKYDFNLLVLNGDILNGLNFKRLHTEHWDVLSALRELSKNCIVVWVHGNHDADSYILSHLLGITVYNKYAWESNGNRYLAIHGHQYDRFYKDSYVLSHIAYAIYEIIRKVDKSGFLSEYIKKHSTSWQRSSHEVAKGAMRYGKFLGADYVFCGHTHKIYSAEKWGVKYYNTGSWNELPSGYIVIKNGEVELLEKK